jgi:diamine N-acetyltransferase
VISITLRPITTRRVARNVVCLRLAPGQEQFVAPNAISIADAYVEKSWHPLAVFAGDELVGFVMYGDDTDTGQWWIIRVMIDERFQGRGYGRAATTTLVDLMREQHGCASIRLGVDPANQRAIGLYESLGFRDTGEVEDDEMIMLSGTDGG